MTNIPGMDSVIITRSLISKQSKCFQAEWCYLHHNLTNVQKRYGSFKFLVTHHPRSYQQKYLLSDVHLIW